ncbi:cytochrome P450 [Actinoplanes sp. N902-109]|uniref:cytochrome P450 n=1 Tax=Actinoplanes sp. (strain N902-109) TaxID=649831 RepID=UPI0003294570|nr:cytochrome P450 [Actinoplanes sp. N902-109]AGL19236.1 putative cytochrome P450 [Actinoplanes sp. N902-109]
MSEPITYLQHWDRTDAFDPPAVLRELGAEQPLSRMVYPDGHVGWLATGLEVAKEVLSSPAFSHNFHSAHFPVTKKGEPFPAMPIIPGMFIHMDPPEHTRYRTMLTGEFTTHRMAALGERIEVAAAEQLTTLRGLGSPADLVTGYVQPLCRTVLNDLLGLSAGSGAVLARLSETANDDDVPVEDEFAASKEAFLHLRDLVEKERADPGDSMIGRLTGVPGLTDREITNMLLVVFAAGLTTCEGALAATSLALLHHRDQLAAFRETCASGAGVPNAVEELLRYTTVNQYQIFRTALSDVEVGGHLVRAGDTVTISLPAANRDGSRFAHPDLLDLDRDPSGHLAFGYGVHICLGQRLARTLLTIALRTLVTGLPELTLDGPVDAVRLRSRTPVFSVHELLVRW